MSKLRTDPPPITGLPQPTLIKDPTEIPKDKNYDVIIVGGGHNGLVCANYLALSKKKVLVLEK